MSTAVEKRMLSLEEIEAQTALLLPERELMHHHKKHKHHHHHHQAETIIIICTNNGVHQHFQFQGHQQGPWGNGFNDHSRFNQGCVLKSGSEGLNPFGLGPFNTI